MTTTTETAARHALLRAALTPDRGDYASEMPVSPGFGALLRRAVAMLPCDWCMRSFPWAEYGRLRGGALVCRKCRGKVEAAGKDYADNLAQMNGPRPR